MWPCNLFTRFKPKNSFWFYMYWVCSGPSSLEEYLDLWTSILKHQNWRTNLIPVNLSFQICKKEHIHIEFLISGKKQLCKKYESYVFQLFPTVLWKQGKQNRKSSHVKIACWLARCTEPKWPMSFQPPLFPCPSVRAKVCNFNSSKIFAELQM